MAPTEPTEMPTTAGFERATGAAAAVVLLVGLLEVVLGLDGVDGDPVAVTSVVGITEEVDIAVLICVETTVLL